MANSPLNKSLCRRDIVDEDKARDHVESGDSARECNAVILPKAPDATRMDFSNGLLKRTLGITGPYPPA